MSLLCWENITQWGALGKTSFKSRVSPKARGAWEKAFTVYQRVHHTTPEEKPSGMARLRRQAQVVVPPESELVVFADVPAYLKRAKLPVLVEDSADLVACERGWRVAQTVSSLKNGQILLHICNTLPSPVLIPQRCNLATVSLIAMRDILSGNQGVLRDATPGVLEVNVRSVGAPTAFDHPALELQGEDLSVGKQGWLTALSRQWTHVFAAHEDNFRHTKAVGHRIPTGEAPPIRDRYRTVPPKLFAELRELLQEMVDSKVVRESSSPWAAPVVLVRKKDGSWRFCVDYHKLNSVTHKDAYPLPRIEESLTSQTRATWYRTFVLASGYWQVDRR